MGPWWASHCWFKKKRLFHKVNREEVIASSSTTKCQRESMEDISSWLARKMPPPILVSRDTAFGKTTQEGVVEARRSAKCVPVLSVHSVGVLTWTSVVSANCLPSLRHLMPVLRASCSRRWWIFIYCQQKSTLSHIFVSIPGLQWHRCLHVYGTAKHSESPDTFPADL